jgi:hypothetical protein
VRLLAELSWFVSVSANVYPVAWYTSVVFNLGYAYSRGYAKRLASIKLKHGNRLNFESALIHTLTKVRPRIEVLACQKQAQSSQTILIIDKIFNHIILLFKKYLCFVVVNVKEHAVSYWLKHYGSISDEVNFLIYLILSAALDPGVYSAFNINEYQKHKNINVSRE